VVYVELGCFFLVVFFEGLDLDDFVVELVVVVRKFVGYFVKFRVGVFEGEVIEFGVVLGLNFIYVLDYLLIVVVVV
ncbi:hypothetical protein G3565_33590, partial [Escherichia coli]|nr:hypothetical protein [Escherichia coli]